MMNVLISMTMLQLLRKNISEARKLKQGKHKIEKFISCSSLSLLDYIDIKDYIFYLFGNSL